VPPAAVDDLTNLLLAIADIRPTNNSNTLGSGAEANSRNRSRFPNLGLFPTEGHLTFSGEPMRLKVRLKVPRSRKHRRKEIPKIVSDSIFSGHSGTRLVGVTTVFLHFRGVPPQIGF